MRRPSSVAPTSSPEPTLPPGPGPPSRAAPCLSPSGAQSPPSYLELLLGLEAWPRDGRDGAYRPAREGPELAEARGAGTKALRAKCPCPPKWPDRGLSQDSAAGVCPEAARSGHPAGHTSEASLPRSQQGRAGLPGHSGGRNITGPERSWATLSSQAGSSLPRAPGN